MYNKHKLRLAIVAITTGLLSSIAPTALAQNVTVDINANIKHSVNGVSDFGRERRITIHASPTENDFLGEKEKLDYLMSLGVTFGRDNGLSMYYFSQTGGDKASSTDTPSPFPYGYANKPNLEQLSSLSAQYKANLATKYADAQEYFGRTSSLIMGSQPRPAYPNWSSYSWFGGGLTSETPWRPRTAQDAADWYAEFLNKFFVQYENDPTALPMPKYWEVVNEPDMLMNVPSHEGHLSTWEELFEFHNVVANTVRNKLGNKAPKIGGMTWGLHDLENGDATATGAPRSRGDDLLNKFYGTDAGSLAIKNAITTGIFAASPTMATNGPEPKTNWYQWDYIWKGFMDAAGKNMDFYSIHLYDWASWNGGGGARAGKLRTGFQTEGVMDLMEWYDMKMLGQHKEVVVSEYGNITGTSILTLDRQRMRWEVLKPFSQMMMQFMERPDYISLSMPFIVVKGEWGDADKNNPYAQSLLDRDYSTCTDTGTAYTNCTWNFNPSIKWYELWRDVDGTRVDTYASDRDIQVDAYVNNKHMYVILNSLEAKATTVDMNFAGITGNAIKSIKMRHLYLDDAIDSDNNTANGVGKPILADATLTSLPKNITIGADATVIMDIEYTNDLNPIFTSNEKKYPAEPLTANAPYRVAANTITTQVNGVIKPTRGEAQLRVTGAFFINGNLARDTADSRISLKINGNTVPFKSDWRGDESRKTGRSMATLEIPFNADFLNSNGNNTVELKTIYQGDVAAVAMQVWDMDTQVTRSVSANCTTCTAGTGITLTQSTVTDLKVTRSVALEAQIAPANASNQNVTWVSSNPSVASVDQNGLVTGNTPGFATITATTVSGALTATANVTVTQLLPETVVVVGVPNPLYIGVAKQLSAAVSPIHSPNRAVTWTSSNTAVATVDSKGLVTGLALGTATISATTTANNIVGTASIQVQAKPLTGIAISPASTLIPQNDSLQIQTTFTPADASNKTVNWTSSNTAVATVSNTGLVTGVGLGTAEITGVTVSGGFTGKTQVEVVASNTALTFVEAENYSRTGGAYAGFVKNSTLGNINDNQTGDWVEFDINFTETGIYQLVLATGSPMNGAGVEFFVDGVSNGRASIPNNGQWDVHVNTVVTNSMQINSAGTHTLKLLSVGTGGAYQWNLDKIGYRLLKATTPTSAASSSVALSSLSSSSTPLSSSSRSSTPASSSSVASSVSSTAPVDGNATVVKLGNYITTGKDGTAVSGDIIEGFNKNGDYINYNTTGDWGDYAVNLQPGNYRVEILASTPSLTGTGAEIILDSVSQGAIAITPTGGWETYNTFTLSTSITVTTAGDHNLRVKSVGATAWQWNGYEVRFVKLADTPAPTPTPATAIGLGNFITTGKDGAAVGGDTIVGFNKNGDFINYNTTGDWGDYLVNLQSGSYRVEILASTPSLTGTGAEIILNSVSQGTIAITPTGGWETYSTFTLDTPITITTSGDQNLRVKSVGATVWQWNGHQVRFVKIADAPAEPDFDKDGIPDAIDPDDDNDGYNDDVDAFPFDPSVAHLGDMDKDFDVDTLDVRLFTDAAKKGLITDLRYDFNNDGIVNDRDAQGITKLCTRSRCAIN